MGRSTCSASVSKTSWQCPFNWTLAGWEGLGLAVQAYQPQALHRVGQHVHGIGFPQGGGGIADGTGLPVPLQGSGFKEGGHRLTQRVWVGIVRAGPTGPRDLLPHHLLAGPRRRSEECIDGAGESAQFLRFVRRGHGEVWGAMHGVSAVLGTI